MTGQTVTSIALGDDDTEILEASVDLSSSDSKLETDNGDDTERREGSQHHRQNVMTWCKKSLSPLHLGDHIKNPASVTFFTQEERLFGALTALLISFCFVNGIVYIFNEVVLYQRYSDDDDWNDQDSLLVAELENFRGPEEDDDYTGSTTATDSPTSSWALSNSHPLSSLDDEQFLVYVGFVLWVTTILAGLGMELLVLLSFLKQGWSKDMEIRWRFAQFFFSLLATRTFGLAMRQEFFALLTLVPGLWKFGFPETIMYMTVSLYKESNGDGTSMSKLHRVADFLNAVGTVVHHGAASLLICMMLSGPVKAERCITDPVLVLLMQHWFVLVHQYVGPTSYLMVLKLLLVEVWFEWTLLSNLESIFDNHWTAALAAVTMLVAHWLYLVAAGLEPSHHCGWDKTRRSEHQELHQASDLLALPFASSSRRRLHI